MDFLSQTTTTLNTHWKRHYRSIETKDLASVMKHCIRFQKSVTRPFLSQSPYRVGSGPRGPPISPVTGFLSSGNLSRGSCSTVMLTTSSVSSSCRGSSNFPAGVFPFLRFPFPSSEWLRYRGKDIPDLPGHKTPIRNIKEKNHTFYNSNLILTLLELRVWYNKINFKFKDLQ